MTGSSAAFMPHRRAKRRASKRSKNAARRPPALDRSSRRAYGAPQDNVVGSYSRSGFNSGTARELSRSRSSGSNRTDRRRSNPGRPHRRLLRLRRSRRDCRYSIDARSAIHSGARNGVDSGAWQVAARQSVRQIRTPPNLEWAQARPARARRRLRSSRALPGALESARSRA
jgi:hypothetical protein